MSHRGFRRWVVVAAICGASGVLLGAFSAHGLAEFLTSRGAEAELVEKRLAQFETGVRYHLIHAVALVAVSAIALSGNAISTRVAGWTAALFVAGIILFSGSLYVLVLTDTPVLGAITPLGGLALIAGWLLLAFSVGGPSEDAT